MDINWLFNTNCLALWLSVRVQIACLLAFAVPLYLSQYSSNLKAWCSPYGYYGCCLYTNTPEYVCISGELFCCVVPRRQHEFVQQPNSSLQHSMLVVGSSQIDHATNLSPDVTRWHLQWPSSGLTALIFP